jgi:hypothetical protein
MKSTMIFARPKPARKPRPEAVELITSWTTRDWADLPVHHPRKL